MGRSIKLVLKGVPPSLNRSYGRADVWEYRKAKREWTDKVLWQLKAGHSAPPKPFERAHVVITYFFTNRRRRDEDNYSGKLFLDGLVRGGVIVDDDMEHMMKTVLEDIDPVNPRTEIVVQEV